MFNLSLKNLHLRWICERKQLKIMLVTKESPGRKMGKVFRKNYIQKIDFQFQRIKTVKVQKSPQSSTSSKQGGMSKLSFFHKL